MKFIKINKLILLFWCTLASLSSFEQCNTNTSICVSGTAGPFTFETPGNPVSSCLDFIGPSVAYIILNISQTGDLNFLITGDVPSGFLDVAVFNIPNGIDPCVAIENTANEISCNYASSSSGCNQIGTQFPCPASISPPPVVTAGQNIMIVVENYSGASSNFTLQIPPSPSAQAGLPTPTITSAGPFCSSSSTVQLVASDAGGTWSGPGVTASGIFDPILAGIGSHTISYSIGIAPCNATATTTITVGSAPISATGTTTICPGGTANLSASGGSTYSWSPSSSLSSSTDANVIASPLTTTTYTVTGSISGCTGTSTVTVTVSPAPIANPVANQFYCSGDPVPSQILSSNPSGATFGWSNNNTSIGLGANGLGDIPSFTALNTTNAPVIATLTFVPSSGSCIGSPLNYTITVNPSPSISASNNGPICESGLLNLVGNGPSSSFYSWVGPNGFTSNSQNPFISNFSAINAGNYTLTVTSNEGCSSVASTSVTYNAASVSNLIADVTSGCEPLKVRFTDLTTPQSTFIIWNFGDGTTSNQLDTVTHVYSDTGSYNVSISTNSNGCSSEITFINYITVYGSAVANFDLNTYSQSIFNPVFQALNSSSNASFYQWYSSNNLSSNAVHPIFTFPADAGGYTIFLIANNEANCPDTTSKVIRIDDELVFFIPNSFTPDGDELNNTFQPVFTSGFDAQSFEMLIYNRFGEVIFETHDASIGWDGTYHNKLVKEGVYSWTVQFKDSNNDKKFTQSGSVTIIR